MSQQPSRVFSIRFDRSLLASIHLDQMTDQALRDPFSWSCPFKRIASTFSLIGAASSTGATLLLLLEDAALTIAVSVILAAKLFSGIFWQHWRVLERTDMGRFRPRDLHRPSVIWMSPKYHPPHYAFLWCHKNSTGSPRGPQKRHVDVHVQMPRIQKGSCCNPPQHFKMLDNLCTQFLLFLWFPCSGDATYKKKIEGTRFSAVWRNKSKTKSLCSSKYEYSNTSISQFDICWSQQVQ